MTAMLSLRGVSRTYDSGAGAVPALKDVSFDVQAGTMVALVGRSGSGKTTLLNMVGGLDSPDTGTVLVDGTDVTALDEDGRSRLRRDSVAYVFQTFGLVPVLSAAENVGVPLRMRRTPRAEREQRVALLLELVGLAGHADQRPDELSGGQQQRVAIARALHARPAVLFADEPTGALDRTTGRQVLELLRESSVAHGQTVVMVSHDPLAASYAESVLFLADGQVVGRLEHADATRIAAAMSDLER